MLSSESILSARNAEELLAAAEVSSVATTSSDTTDGKTDTTTTNNNNKTTAANKSIHCATPPSTQFEIYVSKDSFKFNASHFAAYPGFRERLHGHAYRVSVRLIGSRTVGRDGYLLDFGCVKSVTKQICKEMNEYFLCPMLSEALKITVSKEENETNDMCGTCGFSTPGGSVTIECEDKSVFVFPKSDVLFLPIMHSTAEELAIYLYGRILKKLDAGHLTRRGVREMEIAVEENVGQHAVFRREIPKPGEDLFDVASYVSKGDLVPMPCLTETEPAKKRKLGM